MNNELENLISLFSFISLRRPDQGRKNVELPFWVW